MRQCVEVPGCFLTSHCLSQHCCFCFCLSHEPLPCLKSFWRCLVKHPPFNWGLLLFCGTSAIVWYLNLDRYYGCLCDCQIGLVKLFWKWGIVNDLTFVQPNELLSYLENSWMCFWCWNWKPAAPQSTACLAAVLCLGVLWLFFGWFCVCLCYDYQFLMLCFKDLLASIGISSRGSIGTYEIPTEEGVLWKIY